MVFFVRKPIGLIFEEKKITFFALIGESYTFIRESFALFRKSYALIPEKYFYFSYQNEPNRLS